MVEPSKYTVRVTSVEDRLNFSFVNSYGEEFIFAKNLTGAKVVDVLIQQFSKNGRLKYLGITDETFINDGIMFGPYIDLDITIIILVGDTNKITIVNNQSQK